MARPKITKKIKKSPITSTPAAPKEVSESILRLDPVTRLSLCRFEAEVRAARHQMEAQKAQMSQYLATIDKEGLVVKLQASIYAHMQQAMVMQARYDQISKQVEADLKIVLANYSFDDESGVLHEVGSSRRETAEVAEVAEVAKLT